MHDAMQRAVHRAPMIILAAEILKPGALLVARDMDRVADEFFHTLILHS